VNGFIVIVRISSNCELNYVCSYCAPMALLLGETLSCCQSFYDVIPLDNRFEVPFGS